MMVLRNSSWSLPMNRSTRWGKEGMLRRIRSQIYRLMHSSLRTRFKLIVRLICFGHVFLCHLGWLFWMISSKLVPPFCAFRYWTCDHFPVRSRELTSTSEFCAFVSTVISSIFVFDRGRLDCKLDELILFIKARGKDQEEKAHSHQMADLTSIHDAEAEAGDFLATFRQCKRLPWRATHWCSKTGIPYAVNYVGNESPSARSAMMLLSGS
jgi:hypothetical protein